MYTKLKLVLVILIGFQAASVAQQDTTNQQNNTSTNSNIILFEPDRFVQIEEQLRALTVRVPGLEEEVNLTVNNVAIQDVLRAIGKANNVNIGVDPSLSISINENFSDANVAEVLIYLIRTHNLDATITGNIIRIHPLDVEEEVIVYTPKELNIVYDSATNRISLDLNRDTLSAVFREITRKTGHNIVYPPELAGKTITLYMENAPLQTCMEKLAYSAKISLEDTEDRFFVFDNEKKATPKTGSKPTANQPIESFIEVSVSRFGDITVNVENMPIKTVIKEVMKLSGLDYYIYEDVEGNISAYIQDEMIETLLAKVLYGTNFTFRVDGGKYLIGERSSEGLRESKRIHLKHRSVETVLEHIPVVLTSEIEIKEFHELNSLLVSGSYPKILELIRFIEQIDQPVPVVLIEVMIVDYQRNTSMSTGIDIKIGDQQVTSGGSIYPSVNYNLNSESVNNLLRSFEGFGVLNLGAVTPQFYASIRALEENGFLRVRSTPKLSTLNGHEASLSIGNREYYVVETSNIVGVQNPVPQVVRQYRDVEANLKVTIKPFVSADKQVTLQVDVEQSDFTTRISPEAPPGSVSRNFSSMIRVGDQEMVLLGGLEEKSSTESGSGLPYLSRIPVIRWFFSSRTKDTRKAKLNIFIKPTIIN